MFSKVLMLTGLMYLCSCSDDEKPVANSGGAGSHAAGSAGRSQAGESGSEGGGEPGGRAAGDGGSSTGGAMIGGAGEVAAGGVGGGGSNLGGGANEGGGGSAVGGGAAGSDENPYRGCLGEDRTDNTCPVSGSICDADYGCEPPCPTGTVSCPEPPAGGTATAYCQQRFCRLDCGFGKTCPAGMTCDAATLFCTANGL
jgi:hypothetical protein